MTSPGPNIKRHSIALGIKMDHKSLKLDLIYIIKKLVKEGKALTVDGGNLDLVDGKLTLTGNLFDPLEALAVMKGYEYTPVNTTDNWTDPQGVLHLYNCNWHDMYGISTVDIIVEQAQISKEDIYHFLNGLENIGPVTQSEFYTVGTYVREKFLPLGAHKETLMPMVFKPSVEKLPIYRKFFVEAGRPPRPKKGELPTVAAPTIVQVECVMASGLDDPSIMWAPSQEYYMKIIGPIGFLKNHHNGTSFLMLGNNLFWNTEQAMTSAKSIVRGTYEFNFRKKGVAFTEEEVITKCNEIKEIMLV